MRRTIYWLVLAALLVPAGLLVRDAMTGGLGANPVEEITHRTGDWALYLLLLTLAVSPAMKLSGWSRLINYRRLFGLMAFFYASLHFLTWLVIDLTLYLPEVVEDIARRPYITVGFTALLLMIPLAVTSTRGWIRRLGGRRWSRLHQLVYVSAALAILHYLWLVKADTLKPVQFGLILVVLLLARLVPLRKLASRRVVHPRAGGESRGGSGPIERTLPPGVEDVAQSSE